MQTISLRFGQNVAMQRNRHADPVLGSILSGFKTKGKNLAHHRILFIMYNYLADLKNITQV